MRHRVFGQKLGRDNSSRKALLSNLASAILINGSIETTLAKAKFVRPYVEKLVTAAKRDKLNARRTLASALTKDGFLKLVEEVAPAFSSTNGGYTRIIKLKSRKGDSAPMAKIEFVKKTQAAAKTTPAKKAKTKEVPAKKAPGKKVKKG